jgi:hypothetical protein
LEECCIKSDVILNNDNKVGSILSIILGIGLVINSNPCIVTDSVGREKDSVSGDEEKLVVMVRNEGQLIVKSIEKLLIPDIDIGVNVVGDVSSFILESRNYYFNYNINNNENDNDNIKSIYKNCQYYRTSLLVAKEEANIKKIRKLCYLLGTNGAITNIVYKCTSNQRKIERNDIRSQSIYNKYYSNRDVQVDQYKLINNDQSINHFTNPSLSLTPSNEFIESTQQIELKETYKELQEETTVRLKNSISLLHFLMNSTLSLLPSWSYFKETTSKQDETSNKETSTTQEIESKIKCNFCQDILLKPRKCSQCKNLIIFLNLN